MKTIDETKLVPIDATTMKMGEPVFIWKKRRDPVEGVFLEYRPDECKADQALCYIPSIGLAKYTIDGRLWPESEQVLFRGPVPWKEMTYRIGQRFKLLDGDEHLLCLVEPNHVALFNLRTGMKWIKPVRVDNYCEITETEFVVITARRQDNFTLVQ